MRRLILSLEALLRGRLIPSFETPLLIVPGVIR
jgi:hypothetical protein